MLESCTATVVPSNARGARTCTFSPDDLHQIIGMVVRQHPRGTAKWLQRVTGRGQRTVKYWLSGKYKPRGSAPLQIAAALRAELDQQRRRLEQFDLRF